MFKRKKIEILNQTYDNIVWLTSIEEINNWPGNSIG